MPDDLTEAEAKLRKLGERLRQAWTQQQPVTEQELEAARQVVRRQWEQEHRIDIGPENVPKATPPEETERRKQEEQEQQARERARQQEQDRGYGHSH